MQGVVLNLFFGKYCQDPAKEYHYNDEIDESTDEFGIIGPRLDGKTKYWSSHKSARAIKRDLGDEMFDKYLKFCVIRNPYDKMISSYYWNKSKKSFKDYVKQINVVNLDFYSIDGNSVCDYYIRFENLEEDIIKLCEKLGIEDYDIKKLPKHKSTTRTNKSHYSTFYDEETKQIVYEKHKKEFELFGYKFEEIN